MNTHTCNSIVTHEELKNIASVPTQIISPSKCNPIIYFVQDSLVASYLMTQDDEKIYRPKLENLMMNIKTFDGKYPSSDGKDENGNEYWLGRTVYSIVLPEISLKLKNDSDKMVTIKNGQFLEGNLDSTIIGKRGLIQDILKTYGTNRCHQFLDESQNMFTRWMETHGFSVGIGDGVPINIEMKDKIQEIIENKIEESKEVITSAYHGLYEQELDDTLRLKAMDLNMKKIGSDTVNDVLKYIKSKLTPDNRFNIMATSGAKGKSLNLQQIMGIVGQQEIWGTRILNGYSDRTLPHFHKNDFGLSAKGFVRNSYIRGVNPEEFFFSMMGGRVGMIDTAVKSVTGDTPILITENGKAKRVLIGEWIDNYLDNNLDKIENYEEKNLELFRTEDREFYIPTCDGKGNTSWGKITALTRHDPGNYLYKICTLGGREVKVPESKSLLIWNSVKEEYEEKLTPDVKIGDFVPTTMYLPKHNIECTHIDLTEYLPKDKYVYGTDFHIAYDLVFKKYNGKVPIGWWEKNNGNTFTLPYKHSHCLLRVVRRSNIDYIKKGFVYPYHGKRIETYIPEKFELNRENGVFMGLYLAEGVVDFKSGIISITKNDIEIQEFVKNWFDKYSIKWQINTKTNKFGTSTSIRGYSRILAELFEKWFSKGAAHKHLINEAYTASDDFVIGLLDGYFSGDGTIGKNCIEVGSASKELIEGIGSLCNRFGIFGKYFTTLTKNNNFGTKNILPSHRFSIRSLWAQKFADIIKLTNISKNNKLLTIKCTDIHRNFESQNDTVLDKIVSIELISVKEYPKLYDLTVPTTNNFALANGMNVYDTSETGYISRKLMKAAEDVKILYDGTVRNAANNIIQFVYGDDNYDPIKLEKITIDLIKYNNLEMEEKFKFNFVSDKDWENIILKSAMKDLLAVKDYQKILDEEYQFLIECRDKLRNEYFKNTDIIGIDTFMPFNLFKYLPAMKFKFNINDNNVSDLNPIYVIEQVNELCVFATKFMKDNHNNILTKIIIKSFMSSKMIIAHYKLNKLVFDYIIKELERKLMSAYVQPGEMVGPIAAQSLGESNQQLTLNSVAYDEKLIIVRDGKIGDVVQIGEFIDNIVNNTEDKSLIENHPNDTLLRWTKDTDDYKVISVDEDGVISWKKIEAVTRHPVINEDGSNTLVKVTTRNGRTVRATKAKSFLTRVDNKIVATKGSDLKVGDRLPVMKNFPLNDATIDIKYISNYDDNDDIIIGFNTDLIKGEIHKNDLEILLKKTDKTHKDYKILESALYSDVYFDEIIKIEEISYEKEYVYDLTVEETRTFVHLNGVCLFDTFHQAGSAAGSVAVTSGVPRMKEIISLSKTMKTPSMDIYLSQEYSDDRSKAEKLKNLMKYTKMESIVIKTDIIYENIDEVGIDVNDDEDMEFIKLYYEFNDIVCADNHEDLSKWVLRIEFDREAMMSKNILMSDVEEAIKLNAHSEDAIQCIINDDNSSNLIMRVRVKSETEDENFLSFFKEFEKYIMDMTLKGIKGINAVDVVEGHIVKYNPDGSYNINKEWFLRTDGSNLTETMLMDNVNTTRTFTNDIIETYEIFGIEGVRAKIVKELFAIFSEQGVNQRHINLMVDIMTNRGIIMQIDRHGINRAPDNGVMTKASFEQVTDVFIKASIFNEVDKLTGVSANIMFGQLVPSGTNMFELLLDEEKLMNFGISEEEQQEFEQDELDEDVVQEELNEMYEDMDEELEIGDDDFEFGYSLENVQEYNLGPIKTEEESESVKVVDNTVVKKIIKKKK